MVSILRTYLRLKRHIAGRLYCGPALLYIGHCFTNQYNAGDMLRPVFQIGYHNQYVIP